MENNYYECARDIVHAPSAHGNDYSLCGLTVEKIIPSKADYDPDTEDDILPQMVATTEKVTCPDCAEIIRYCCMLGKKSIKKNLEIDCAYD